MEAVRKEGYVIYVSKSGRWGHVRSAECKDNLLFLHINNFVDCGRGMLLGERISFAVTKPFGHAKSPNRLLRCISARPYGMDEPATSEPGPDEPAGEAAPNNAEEFFTSALDVSDGKDTSGGAL